MSRTPTTTVGQRLREARERAELTQADIAKSLGQSRSSIAQWEGDVTAPSVDKLTQVAGMLQTTPQYIAFGISDVPQFIEKAPEGTVSLKEITFGESSSDITPSGQWNVPVSYLKGDLHVLATDGVVIWRTETDIMAPAYEFGDRLIIDTNAKRVSPPGVFLIWDGVGPSLASISVMQATDKGQKAKVKQGDNEYEADVAKIQVLGRVKGRIHAS